MKNRRCEEKNFGNEDYDEDKSVEIPSARNETMYIVHLPRLSSSQRHQACLLAEQGKQIRAQDFFVKTCETLLRQPSHRFRHRVVVGLFCLAQEFVILLETRHALGENVDATQHRIQRLPLGQGLL